MTKYSAAELVTSCYRAFLGRDPENQDVVNERVDAHSSIDGLISSFIKSDEFLSKHSGQVIHDYLCSNHFDDQSNIETDVTPEILEKMFERVQAGWQRLGETEPYWSVITADEFKMSNVKKNMEAFLTGGRANMQWFENVARRNGVKLSKKQSCLELGCGVGRVTLPLSDTFEAVTGIDVSKGNLNECNALIEKSGKTNISTLLIKDIQELRKLGSFDVFYSIIVLQHNPPPVQKFMLETILGKINPGGVVYFQLPTRIPNYTFRAQKYLRTKETDLEMHALPMHVVFSLLRENGFSVLEVFQDQCTGMPGSHTFFAVKTGPSGAHLKLEAPAKKRWSLFKS